MKMRLTLTVDAALVPHARTEAVERLG